MLVLESTASRSTFGQGLASVMSPSTTDATVGPSFSYNLRLPGQYYDSETGLNQNYNRDYDPAVGRYIESDPIGLKGGYSTYAYAGDDPTDAVDPTGLIKYWPAAGDASKGRAICNGRNGMTVQQPYLTPDEKKCGLGECVRRHEIIHIIDLHALDPSVCIGQ